MQHWVYVHRRFGEVVDKTFVLHLSQDEMLRAVSLLNTGAIAPGEIESEDRDLLNGFDAAICCAEGIVKDGRRHSNTEFPDFDIEEEA